jgi:hypothetical protein
MPDVPNALPRGYALHEYRVESVLGAGGFGLTYLATDGNLNLKVALKEYLPGDFAARAGDSTVQPRPGEAAESFQWGLQRFMDEARTLASFRHPNIVRVMRFFEANRTGYMVMEFVEGQPLSDWIGARRPLPQQAFLALIMPLLDGLEVIHKAGYLHRDIKPANIFMREDGSPVLLDFGSARQLAGGGNQELTAVVSPGYAPLEQYHAHGKQGAWSDLYAFGGVLYWMLTGTKPIEAAARVRQDIMPSAAKVGEGRGYASDFLAAVDWALKPHEDERPRSVAEFRRALLGAAPPAAAERAARAGRDDRAHRRGARPRRGQARGDGACPPHRSHRARRDAQRREKGALDPGAGRGSRRGDRRREGARGIPEEVFLGREPLEAGQRRHRQGDRPHDLAEIHPAGPAESRDRPRAVHRRHRQGGGEARGGKGSRRGRALPAHF